MKTKILEDYISYKRTTVNYEPKIKLIIYFVKPFIELSNKPLGKYEEKELINYLHLMDKKYSIGSMNQIKPTIKEFIKWHYIDHPARFRNLDKLCRTQKKEKTYSPEQMLSKEDIEKLVQGENETRWKAYWLLLFYGGFRPGEVCKLKWEDIVFDKEGAFINVYVKKNGNSFVKYIPEDVCFYIRKIQNNNSEYLFPTKRTNKHGVPVGDSPMTVSGVWQRLTRISKEVLGKHVNPYILRHSIATILYNQEGVKEEDAAQQMGHSIDMKKTYNNLSREKIKERMKKIYINPEDLPEEKKPEVLKRLEEVEAWILDYQKAIKLQPDVKVKDLKVLRNKIPKAKNPK